MQHSEPVKETTVLIVGAGPTGLFLAAQFLRWNVDFIIVDEKKGRSTHSKAIALQALPMEMFDELGIADRFLNAGLRATGLKLFEKGREHAAIDLSNLGKGMSAFPFVLSIPQNETERILIEYIESTSRKVEWGNRLVNYKLNGDFVEATFAAGTLPKIHAKFLVGCDGASSMVRELSGLGFRGATNPNHFYVADVVISQGKISKDKLNMILIPGSFILYFPLPGRERFRIVGELPPELEQAKEFDEVKDFVVHGTNLDIQIESCEWFSTYSVHTRMAEEFSRNNIFLAGDAAHVHTPAGGQGMNTGIADAYNLSWKLAFYIRTGVKAPLETYSPERQDFARKLLNTTDRLFRFMTAASPFRQWLRRVVFSFAIRMIVRPLLNKKIFPIISQTGFTYRTGFFKSGKRGRVVAGKRLPYVLAGEDKPLLDLLCAPAFKIICRDSQSFRDNELLRIITVSQNVMDQLGVTSDSACILVRPDNVVYRVGDKIGIKKALEEIGIE